MNLSPHLLDHNYIDSMQQKMSLQLYAYILCDPPSFQYRYNETGYRSVKLQTSSVSSNHFEDEIHEIQCWQQILPYAESEWN